MTGGFDLTRDQSLRLRKKSLEARKDWQKRVKAGEEGPFRYEIDLIDVKGWWEYRKEGDAWKLHWNFKAIGDDEYFEEL